MHRSTRRGVPPLLAASTVAVALLLGLPGVALGQPSAPTASVSARGVLQPFTNVSYRSSVDHFPLSYDEWLPAGYNASRPLPLAVFLHGIGNSTVAVRGGVNNFLDVLRTPSSDGATERSLLENASLHHFIFISLNTRSSAGLYANTPCGGPQMQDVLDAIAHEQALRKISSVYLIGFSMGAFGALEIAGHTPGLVRTIAIAAPATDLYQEYAYLLSTGNVSGGFDGLVDLINNDTCRVTPSPTNTTVDNRVYSFLSVGRFAPQNFSNISVWVSSGGFDTAIPNNGRFWPYLQVNDSFLLASCRAATTLGEPTGCTASWASLHAAHPGEFLFRDIYEPFGIHSLSQLDPADIFAFFAGTVAPGLYHSTFPPRTIAPGA